MPQIMAYLNREFFDTGDAFGTAKSLGFDAVEIPESFFTPPEHEKDRMHLARILKTYGLKARWHTNPQYNRHLSSENAVLRSENIERMLWELAFARKMGWNEFIIHPGPAATERDKQRVYESLKVINEKACKLHIQLLLENASGGFDGDPYELVRIMNEVPGLKITLDLVHAFRSFFCKTGKGTLIDYLSILSPFISSFQFNDYDGEKRCTVGTGVLPWQTLMPKILSTQCKTWTIELHTVQETVSSKEYLQRWLD